MAQNSFNDLVGTRASSLNYAMGQKGYVFVKSDKSKNGVYSHYWKNSKKKCVTAHLLNGEVAWITNTPAADCNKGSDNSHNNNSNYYNKNYTGDPKLGDLKGWNADRAYKEIRNRGYRHIKDYRNNGKLVRVWYNSKYKKCKKTAEKNGNIDLVDNSKQCSQ